MCGARRHRPGTHAALTATIVIVALAGTASAGKLEQAIEVRSAANASSTKSQELIDKLSDRTDALVEEYRRVVQQIEALRVYNAQVEELLGAQQAEAASLQEQIDRVAFVGRELTPLMLKMIDALEAFVQLDVPFLPEERRTRVEHLRALMGRADVTNSEKYRRILEAYQIENEYGRTIEAYQGTLESEGTSRTVSFLRVGRIALIYQTLNGSESGAWNARNGAWVKLPGMYRLAIRQGLRIARKQAAPDLLRLPVAAAEAAR